MVYNNLRLKMPEQADPNVLYFKIAFIIFIFCVAMIAGIIPAKSKRCTTSQTFLGIANSFAGGVFIAIAFMHILPEATEEYKEWIEGGHDHTEAT